MAVPTIPSAISLSSIQTEFGGSNPISISEYYSGGSYVAGGTQNATSVVIPTSGMISFSNFSGAAAAPAVTVALPTSGWSQFYSGDTYAIGSGASYYSTTGEGQVVTARARLTMHSNGVMVAYGAYNETGCGGSFTYSADRSFTWLTSGNASDVYVNLTVDSGSDSFESGSSASDTDLQLNTDRSWDICVGVSFGGSDERAATGTLYLKNSSGTVLESDTFVISATATNSD